MENFSKFILSLFNCILEFIEWKRETKRKPNWVELPRDMTTSILKKLSVIDLISNAQYVCCEWRNICKDPLTWSTIEMCEPKLYQKMFHSHHRKMCRYVIDLSSGHLNHIDICGFGDNALLEYIIDSSSQITSLGLKCCFIFEKTLHLNEIAKKLPQLYKLSVCFCPDLSKNFLEAIGTHCPSLKKLNLCKSHMFGYEENKIYNMEDDEDAFAIAKTMPQLMYLQLYGNRITNVGLLAILKGCPCLKWVHIIWCPYLNLQCSLLERCVKGLEFFRAETGMPPRGKQWWQWDPKIDKHSYYTYIFNF